MDIRPTLTSCPDSAVASRRLPRPVEIRHGCTTALQPNRRTRAWSRRRETRAVAHAQAVGRLLAPMWATAVVPGNEEDKCHGFFTQ